MPPILGSANFLSNLELATHILNLYFCRAVVLFPGFIQAMTAKHEHLESLRTLYIIQELRNKIIGKLKNNKAIRI
ncbi:predicted protein [Sclerotinia sclerotiorum 1980 UF-70]|uniref:Uncharacterized protein n=1 Tax=Sclerotinia sclerotiorum (strain ATCC 18683 / 1980 / Ss-1) TaxID=665079 RepID=A7EDZ9_SCLS1|nr:predicted protein [Sclerotinia sclerotiorum 1980 UF-70]EDO01065.1 predicted protein [Sclerotinia sclerotiorum 1980 UF-70]